MHCLHYISDAADHQTNREQSRSKVVLCLSSRPFAEKRTPPGADFSTQLPSSKSTIWARPSSLRCIDGERYSTSACKGLHWACGVCPSDRLPWAGEVSYCKFTCKPGTCTCSNAFSISNEWLAASPFRKHNGSLCTSPNSWPLLPCDATCRKLPPCDEETELPLEPCPFIVGVAVPHRTSDPQRPPSDSSLVCRLVAAVFRIKALAP